MTKLLLSILILLMLINRSFSQEDLGEIEVIGISPLPGIEIDRNRIPNSSQSLKGTEITESLSSTFADIMGEKLSGVTVKDVQNSPFQKNLDYRGFTASPLLGESQGLSVYLNGIRINEGFGDTLQWELIPENAIKNIDLMSSNPVFGLNALGGSLAFTTKKGLDYISTQSMDNKFETGSFDAFTGTFELGSGTENTGLYISAEKSYDGGWRDNSPGDLKKLFMNYGILYDNFDVDFTLMNANTKLNGNGVSPTELLNVSRESVFTWPDYTANKVFLVSSSANFYLKDDSIVNTSIYYRRLIRDTLNADELDAEECDDDNDNGHQAQLQSDFGVSSSPLCGDDNKSGDYGILIDQYGNAIASDESVRKYGLLNKSSTMTVTWGGSLQYNINKNFYNKDHNILVGTSIDKTRTAFHSHGELGQLQHNRTVTNIYNADGGLITLEAEQEHTGANGGKESATKRGDIGNAQLASKVDYYGIYVNDTIKLDDQMDLTVSSRANLAYTKLYDHLKTSFTRTETITGSHRYFRINPSIGLTYKYDQNVSLRASYKEANRTPAPVELSCASPTAPCRLPNSFVADPPLEQVVTKGIEVGARGRINNHKWEITAYRFINDDDIIFVSTGTGVSSGYFKNFGETKRQGLELSLNSKYKNILGGLNLYSNYSLLGATYETNHTLPAANHPAGSNNVEIGDTIPGMPKHTFKAGVNQNFLTNFNSGLNMIYSSGVYLRGDESNQLKTTNPYMVFNATSSWKPLDNFEMFARINNILNSKYETMGVLGEASASEVNVPISELGDTGSGTAVGALDPRFLSPGSPLGIYFGVKISW